MWGMLDNRRLVAKILDQCVQATSPGKCPCKKCGAARPVEIDPGCEGKERFENRSRAEQVTRRMTKGRGAKGKSRADSPLPVAYKCTTCGCWHIGGVRK